MTEADAGSAAASYSTGGGGVVLEHQYGACLLACLLTGNPVPELGDDATVTTVRFQASAVSAVDDLLISGRTPDGGVRQVSVGVRRAPKLTKSDEKSIPLIASYLKVVTGSWGEVLAGRWRLALAVASPNTAVKQVGQLAEIARARGGEAAFRADAEHGVHDGALRDRLGHLDALVASVLDAGADVGGVAAGELTWRLLLSLRVRELRLEGADTTDRTVSVASLRSVTAAGTAVAADSLFGKLERLTRRYAPAGANVTEATLRRDLSGTSLARSPSYPTAWAVLDRLAAQLDDDTRFRLADASSEVRVDRQEARHALITSMRMVAGGAAALVITGEPDVGKSALSLLAASELADAGIPVTRLSLRDLTATMLELEALLGASLTDVLGATVTGDGRLLLVDGAEATLEGRGPLLTAVAAAALRAGMGVVAVTRSDGASAAKQALADAAEAADLTVTFGLHEVKPLTQAEITQVSAAFPVLARVASELRASWLLGRPGLVDLLLRAGAAADLPAGPLSEADVFAAIWHQLVRHGEITEPGGPTPDAREQAMVALARRRLLPGEPGETLDASALPALRSDGLLRPAGPTSAWNPGEKFASDLVTDLAVARLLLIGGWPMLSQAGAPRWALRAARLACQARIASAGADSEQARQDLQLAFDDLADQHGQRWAEVPTEALLTLGWARQALERAWPALLADDCAGMAYGSRPRPGGRSRYLARARPRSG